MTTEEKAKAYDEALERAQEYLENSASTGASMYAVNDALKGIFPELAESEDERIRKTLLRCCDDWEKGQFGCMAAEDVPKIRAYLKKQKEQKPIKWDDKDLPQGGESIMINRILHSLMLYREMLKDSNFEKDYIKTTVNDCLEDEKWLSSFLETSQKPAEWRPYDREVFTKIKELIDAHFSEHEQREIFKDWLDEHISQPAEWSEEDEYKVDDICKLIEHATIIPRSGDDDTGIPPTRLNDKYKGELKSFVKSLYPQSQWKPSEE